MSDVRPTGAWLLGRARVLLALGQRAGAEARAEEGLEVAQEAGNPKLV